MQDKKIKNIINDKNMNEKKNLIDNFEHYHIGTFFKEYYNINLIKQEPKCNFSFPKGSFDADEFFSCLEKVKIIISSSPIQQEEHPKIELIWNVKNNLYPARMQPYPGTPVPFNVMQQFHDLDPTAIILVKTEYGVMEIKDCIEKQLEGVILVFINDKKVRVEDQPKKLLTFI